MTAWHTLTTDFGIALPYPKPDEYVPPSADAPFLVWGGATSVGQYALQILRYYGYTKLVATSSPKHHKYLQSLGATVVLDYADSKVTEQLLSLLREDAQPAKVIDCVGSARGSISPIARIVKAADVVAVMLPVIIKDASETEAPEYAMDPATVSHWSNGVIVRGVRTHFYLEVRY